MKRLAGVLCAILGAILPIGGYFAFWYEVSGGDGLWWSMNPYRYLAFPLIVLGVILIIAGAFLYFYTPKENPSSGYFGASERIPYAFMSRWSRKREYDYIGLLIGLFLLVVATFIMWIAKLTYSILLGVIATIIFIIGFYAIIRKKEGRAEINRAR